jgi:hypothetical protein
MAWATTAEGITALRNLLHDGPTDKLRSRKQLLEYPDGTNVKFKTFEYRRLTDFTSSSDPFGVFVNRTLVAVTSDDIATGWVTLTAAPAEGAHIEATYYIQWFIDIELQAFLENAQRWMNCSTDITTINDGLIPAALKYAASEAYQDLANRMLLNESATYRTEDAPDNENQPLVATYLDQASKFFESAIKARDDFYKRKGKALAPRSAVIAGCVREVKPNR